MLLFYKKQPKAKQSHLNILCFNIGIPHFIVFHFTVFDRNCIFLQIEGKSLSQQKDYDSLKAQIMVSIFSNKVFFN